MRTFSFFDSDGPSTPSSASVISLPDTDSDDDFEVILMPSSSAASPAPLSLTTSNDLPSVTDSLGSLSLSGSGSGNGSESEIESERARRAARRSGAPSPAEVLGASRRTSVSSGRAGSGSGSDKEHTFLAPDSGADADEDTDGASVASVSTVSGDTHRPSHSSVPTSLRPTTGHSSASILSASDARESIDSFLTDPSFTSDKANQLRLWQSLCVELGLVGLEDDDTPPAHLFSARPRTPTRSRRRDRDSDGDDDDDNDATPTTSRSATPTQSLPPLPTSLNQAKRLLSARAHVNIGQYLAARADPARHTQSDAVGKYADLVYPSATSLMRSMRREFAFVPLDDAKREWLQPLLKDFGFRRRRGQA